MPLAAGVRMGPFEIVATLGAGGMGEVYRARDTRLDRIVALKRIRASEFPARDRLDRLACEARAISRLNHPHICALYDVGEHESEPFLVMEYVQGETLATRLDRGPFPVAEALRFGAQIADALACAHREGVVHGDLKPGNIMLARDGVKLLDFGLARLGGERDVANSNDVTVDLARSADDAIAGTLPYMAPEQLERRAVDARSDLFALGGVLYEMIAGRPPFERESGVSLIVAILTQSPPPVSTFQPLTPRLLDRAIQRCLAKDPDRRWQTASDLGAELDYVLGTLQNRQSTPAGARRARSQLAAQPPTPRTLPQPLTRFIGRSREVAEIREGLKECRLVTLAGPGGMGKTRIALQMAAAAISDYADGVWFVDFAPISNREFVPYTLAATLGVREVQGRTITETLTAHLSSKRLLLVLDNCEHLVAECAALASTLLQACPHIHVLATSREFLSIDGERVFQLPPLGLPKAGQLSLSSVADQEAVQLFVDRARLARSTFALTAGNAAAVANICLTLEGMPLAIELAASHVKALSVEHISARVNDRFGLLTRGSRTSASRHHTLLAATDWSYNLLSPPEKKLFRRLSVFSGGWTLEAAEAVCAFDGIALTDIVRVLSALVDKSLVLVSELDGEARYRFMVTLREYAQRRLQQSRERTVLQERHAKFFTDMALEGAANMRGRDQGAWLERLNIDYDNMRVALSWGTMHDVNLALQLATALWRFWILRGYWSEGRGWLTDLLRLERAHPDPAMRVKALNAAATLAQRQGDHETARSMLHEALELARQRGDESEIASVLNVAAMHEADQGEFATSRTLLEQSLEIRRRHGNKSEVAITLNNLGLVALRQAQYARAQALLDESLAIFREVDDKHGIALSLVNHGDVLERLGEGVKARSAVEDGIAVARTLGDKLLLPPALNTLGDLLCRHGEHDTARVLNEEALEIARQVGERQLIATTLLSLGIEAEHREAYAMARSTFEEALILLREVDYKPKLSVALNCLGRLAARSGDYATARRHYKEGLEMCRRIGMRDGIADSLLGLADVARLEGQNASALRLCQRSLRVLRHVGDQTQLPRLLESFAVSLPPARRDRARAVWLWGAAERCRERMSICRPPNERAAYESHVDTLRRDLGPERFATAWTHGREMTWRDAIQSALDEDL